MEQYGLQPAMDYIDLMARSGSDILPMKQIWLYPYLLTVQIINGVEDTVSFFKLENE
jgi:hypothetical protein